MNIEGRIYKLKEKLVRRRKEIVKTYTTDEHHDKTINIYNSKIQEIRLKMEKTQREKSLNILKRDTLSKEVDEIHTQIAALNNLQNPMPVSSRDDPY
jgi:hypothetical protein